jgi:hypothetical protein
MGKSFTWFVVGMMSAFFLVEIFDGKPAKKVDYNRLYFNTRTIYRPYPNHYYYDRHPDTFNSQRPQNNSGGYNRSSGENRTNTPTKTFNHTPQQRTESWGTKN